MTRQIYDRFPIMSINSGLQTNLKPFMIPDDAFEKLQNAYVFRGRVRKRFGSRLMGVAGSDIQQIFNSRLGINLGNTNGSGNFSGTVPGAIFDIGQQFSVEDDIYTVYQTGINVSMLATSGSGTFSTTNGDVTITGATALSAVIYYPSQPVMGLIQHEEGGINDDITYGFDTQFSYQFTGGSWSRLGTAVWTGDDTQFFWGYNYRGSTASSTLFFVTNFNTPDQMKYWDGSSWTNFNPQFNAAGDTIETARIIIPFKDRLVLLNVVEKISSVNTSIVNRCRFSQNGDPTEVNMAPDNNQGAWLEDVAGKGGYVDAPTKQSIITAQILKDRLIVFFESSTWELVYTGNEILPFRWQQINTELGAESTFSIVPFDKVMIGIGQTGIHACNGANVERIDEKIPQLVFDILDANQGPTRVCGIRDYFTEMIYWTFPTESTTYPQQILVYNYQNGSWAFNDDSFTTFGYYQNLTSETWASTQFTWEESIQTWNSGTQQEGYRNVIAGNQQGFVFIIDSNSSSNAPSLAINNITYSGTEVTVICINHNLNVGDYVLFENIEGITGLNNIIFEVNNVISNDEFIIFAQDIDDKPIIVIGTYTGAGTLTRISNIQILSKQYNPYADKGMDVYLAKIDFNVDATEEGEIVVDYYPSFSELSMVDAGIQTGAILGNNILETFPYDSEPFESQQSQFWHPVYFQAEGETVQLSIYFNDRQLRTQAISQSDFQLNAMVLYMMGVSRLQ